MEFFRDTDIQFMKHRHRWVILSAAFLLLSVFAVFVRGRLNLGIDFIGGTELTLKFRSEPEIQRLREIVASAGFGDALIQTFGDTESGEVLVKAPIIVDSEEGSQQQIVAALDGAFNSAVTGLDLNLSGTEALTELLLGEDPEGRGSGDPTVAHQRYSEVADSILSVRRSKGLIADWSEVQGAGGSIHRFLRLCGPARVSVSSRCSASNTSTPRLAESCAARGSWQSFSRFLGCLPKSGSASSSVTASERS